MARLKEDRAGRTRRHESQDPSSRGIRPARIRPSGGVNTARRPPCGVPHEHALNVAGTEWIIIVFAVLVIILGTNKLPEAAKKFGRAVNEYNRAKEGVRDQVQGMAGRPGAGGAGAVRVAGPVESERAKLEAICDSLGIDHAGRADGELRRLVAARMGADPDAAAPPPPGGGPAGPPGSSGQPGPSGPRGGL